MTRVFLLGVSLCLCFWLTGCSSGGDAVFEESEAPTAEEEAEMEAYGESLGNATPGGDTDPFPGN